MLVSGSLVEKEIMLWQGATTHAKLLLIEEVSQQLTFWRISHFCGRNSYVANKLNIPGTSMTSIFEGQPPKTRPFPTKTKVI